MEKTYEIVDSVESFEKKLASVREAQKIFATYTQEQVDKIFFEAAMAANQARIPLQILLSLYKGHYLQLILSGIFFALKHACVWYLPVATAGVINIASGYDDAGLSGIIFYISIEIGLVLINVPANYLYVHFRSLAIRNMEAGLRGALVRKLQQLSITYHKEMQSGRLQSKIMRDVEAIETLSQQLFTNILTIMLNLIVAFAVTGMRSRTVLVFFVICGPVAALTMVAFRKQIKRTNSNFRKEMETTSAKVMEMVELIPVTRAHALEDEEIDKMENQLSSVAKSGYRLDIVQANFGAVGWCVFQVFQILCLGFTGYLAFHGKTTVGDITLYQTYFSTIVNQISSFINLLPIISKGLESVNSVGEVLLANDVENNKGKTKIKSVRGEFDFENLCFAYDSSKPVLNHLNLHVAAGETIALVGESGAGKSTVLNMVIGFNKPDSGRVLLDGVDMNTINLQTYRQHIAVVPQTSILFSGTIRDNITYGVKKISEQKLNQVIDAANLRSFIDGLPDGLDTVVGEHGGKLSGGQRQRISIARALMRDPDIIILDEATSALDSISEKEIQEALNNLTKDRTTFIVAHRLSTIKGADKIAVMRDGHCTEYGSYDELMALKGEFYEMRRLQL